MPNQPNRPDEVDADAKACAIDDNDPLLKDAIDDNWINLAHERICREFARQLKQQENMRMTTNNITRLGNVRALDNLDRELERIARRNPVLATRAAAKDTVNPHDAFNTLERELLPDLEAAAAQRDSAKAQTA